ncbi:Serine/threonine-protein kinase 17A [Marasmius tenuissimus]|uniref:Serine/threonine-protein kinase 17A n=1 Tax=Marasmius tenuissimus TaxID=585030 RepID=A0ABR2ZH16_9AGAR
MAFDETETLVVLLFGLKLVKVQCKKWTELSELLDQILQSEEHGLPERILNIMKQKQYRGRNLRYLTLKHPHFIHDLNDVPSELDINSLIPFEGGHGFTTQCANGRLPDDGSCLNLVVEEPLSIEQLEGTERFCSYEVILFLKKFGIEVTPRGGKDSNIGSGRMNETRVIWCKIVSKREFQVHEDLKEHDPDSHHVVPLIVDPLLLPTGDYLITMPHCGTNLYMLIKPSERSVLAGSVILRIAQQLCRAIAFLHSHNMYHLDIKPQNLALNTENNSNELHVIDLGWVMRGQQPCYLRRATGTYEYSAPEVRRWHEWEDAREEEPESVNEAPPPKRFNPLKADVWAVGNVLLILLSNVLEDEELDVEFADRALGVWDVADEETSEDGRGHWAFE